MPPAVQRGAGAVQPKLHQPGAGPAPKAADRMHPLFRAPGNRLGSPSGSLCPAGDRKAARPAKQLWRRAGAAHSGPMTRDFRMRRRSGGRRRTRHAQDLPARLPAVMLLDLGPQTRDQPSLLPEEAAPPAGRDHDALMEATDRHNQGWGKGTVAVGSAVQRAPGACGKYAARACAQPNWIRCRWRGKLDVVSKLVPGLKRPINLTDPPAAIAPEQTRRRLLGPADSP